MSPRQLATSVVVVIGLVGFGQLMKWHEEATKEIRVVLRKYNVSHRLRLLISNEVVGTAENGQLESSFKVVGKRDWKTARLEIMTPTGWSDVTNSDLRYRFKFFHPEEYEDRPFDIPGPIIHDIKIYVDNFQGSELHLACGQIEFTIAADSRTVVSIPTVERPLTTPLTMNGEDLGSVVPKQIEEFGLDATTRDHRLVPSGNFGTAHNYLLDPSGKRSYRVTTHGYSIGGMGSPEGDSVVLQKGVLHEMGSLDYIFKPAPNAVKVFGYSDSDISVVNYDEP